LLHCLSASTSAVLLRARLLTNATHPTNTATSGFLTNAHRKYVLLHHLAASSGGDRWLRGSGAAAGGGQLRKCPRCRA
jgi:hypothetical protein